MEQALFLGLLIFLSLVDMLARKAREKQSEVEALSDAEGEAGLSTSESMVPDEIWDAVGAPARGDGPEEPTPTAERRAHGPSPIVSDQVGRGGEVGSRTPIGEHPIHRTHAGYGTDPSERRRATVAEEGPGRSQRDARAVRSLLRQGERSELRQALVLQEVLGPPAALKDSGGR